MLVPVLSHTSYHLSFTITISVGTGNFFLLKIIPVPAQVQRVTICFEYLSVPVLLPVPVGARR
jgi:hypothetical protein